MNETTKIASTVAAIGTVHHTSACMSPAFLQFAAITRLLPRSPRAKGRRSAGSDPLHVSIGELLVLPDGHIVLEVVDQAACSGEGFSAMRSGHSDDDCEVADSEVTHAVHCCHCDHVAVARDALCDSTQVGQGVGVGGVAKACYVAPAVFVADRSDKDRDAAGCR